MPTPQGTDEDLDQVDAMEQEQEQHPDLLGLKRSTQQTHADQILQPLAVGKTGSAASALWQ